MEEPVATLDLEQETTQQPQPEHYDEAELSALRDFVDLIKNDESRVALACWGDHSDYSHGY